ncbi:MAG: class I SAM-dependent methyltransferase [Bacteroidia bacterium]
MKKEAYKDVLQWDVDSWQPAIEFWSNHVDLTKTTLSLEIGGREGGLSLWLALNGSKVVCSDLQDVQNSASPLHQKYKVEQLVQYQDIDATNIPYENHFDVVVFKSFIGGIGRNDNIEFQRQTFKEIHKALKPGGKLLFAENLLASPLHQFLRKRFVGWGSSWRYPNYSEMKHFLADFSEFEMKSTGVIATFGRSEAQRNFLAKIDKAVLNRISPPAWRYIAFGYAVK